MQDTHDKGHAPAGVPRYVTDAELAPILRVSPSFLQKDRRTARLIPFVRLGDRCLYDVDAVLTAVKGLTVGGTASRRNRSTA